MVVVESDDWQDWGRSILAPDVLARIELAMEQSPVILEHWFYRGGSAPDRLVFDSYEDFREYLASKVAPGDSLYLWNYAELCRDDNDFAHGKYPDARGRTPRLGAY